MQPNDRALRAEAIMWDYEPDFLPAGMEIVDREDLLMWKRPHGPVAERRSSNRVSYVRTTSGRVLPTIDEVFEFFGAPRSRGSSVHGAVPRTSASGSSHAVSLMSATATC